MLSLKWRNMAPRSYFAHVTTAMVNVVANITPSFIFGYMQGMDMRQRPLCTCSYKASKYNIQCTSQKTSKDMLFQAL